MAHKSRKGKLRKKKIAVKQQSNEKWTVRLTEAKIIIIGLFWGLVGNTLYDLIKYFVF